MRSIAVRVGIIGAIVLGGFLIQQWVSGNAGDLAVGDCFDEPEVITDTVEDVQHHPCTDPHHGEVFFVGNYEPSGAYPTDQAFGDFIRARCAAAFNQYTGLDIATAADLDFSAFYPTADGWGNGDRKVICYAVKVDGSKFTQSIKKA